MCLTNGTAVQRAVHRPQKRYSLNERVEVTRCRGLAVLVSQFSTCKLAVGVGRGLGRFGHLGMCRARSAIGPGGVCRSELAGFRYRARVGKIGIGGDKWGPDE